MLCIPTDPMLLNQSDFGLNNVPLKRITKYKIYKYLDTLITQVAQCDLFFLILIGINPRQAENLNDQLL